MRAVILAFAVAILVAQTALAGAPDLAARLATPSEHTRSETLWIFDADFEDLVGDNAGWMSNDRTGTLAVPNHWHKDTIRINGFEHLGDSTWWCGTYSPCWTQPRGYGNGWVDILQRHFDEALGVPPAEVLKFEYDQRIAMEKDYDYGYVDVSTDGGDTWTTVSVMSNPGFVGTPGTAQDWDSTHPLAAGHQTLYLSGCAGVEFDLRFRFESDMALSSQDDYDSAVRDGAWQLDNFVLSVPVNPPEYLFVDDCESPGSNGWVNAEIPASGQVGVTYQRRYETFDGHTGWMMAAYDTTSGGMVDGQDCHLVSPPIDIASAPSLVARWEGWFDLTYSGDDLVSLWTAVSDVPDCFEYGGSFNPGPVWGPTYGGPMWFSVEQEWGPTGGWDWLSLLFRQFNHEPMASHGMGFVIDRVRVGIPLETGIPDVGAPRVALDRPHPSPFSDETVLTYSVSTRGRATARIVDVAGRVVTTLLDRRVEPGEYSLSWDGTTDAGTRAASGVYFARLEFDSGETREEATRKVILLD